MVSQINQPTLKYINLPNVHSLFYKVEPLALDDKESGNPSQADEFLSPISYNIRDTLWRAKKKNCSPWRFFFFFFSLFCIISQRFGLYQLVYITAWIKSLKLRINEHITDFTWQPVTSVEQTGELWVSELGLENKRLEQRAWEWGAGKTLVFTRPGGSW